MKNVIREKKRELAGITEKENFKSEVKKIYKSKIADVPTPGYTGHSSIYVQPVSYLNKDKILSELEKQEQDEKARLENIDNETVSGYYTKSKEAEKEDPDEVRINFLFKFIIFSYLMLLVMEDTELVLSLRIIMQLISKRPL